MADANPIGEKRVVRYSLVVVHKLAAGVALLAFCVVLGAGLMAEARIVTITYRAFVVMLVIGIVSRVVTRVLTSYEEINGGKA